MNRLERLLGLVAITLGILGALQTLVVAFTREAMERKIASRATELAVQADDRFTRFSERSQEVLATLPFRNGLSVAYIVLAVVLVAVGVSLRRRFHTVGLSTH
jgi:hypothetical protein